MALDKISVSPSEYVVLDVETNGLKSKEHDLLSLSIFKPDDNKEFDRLFPLDLNDEVPSRITAINGITDKDLRGLNHLTQDEFNALVADFELGTRTILHYGEIDRRFVRDYLDRHNIEGFDKLRFFNFKKRICSSRFSSGNLTKDNLCKMFGIEGVQEVHTGINDCKLEWELFQKIDGDYLLVTSGFFEDNVFRLNEDYIVTVSYLGTFPNLSKAFERPYIRNQSEEIFRYTIVNDTAERFETNISGVTVEHLLNTLLSVQTEDSSAFLLENKRKIQFLGKVGQFYDVVPLSLNPDGTVTAERKEDKGLEERINRTNNALRPELATLVELIKNDIFHGSPIKSQELVVNDEMGILALCDLSTDDAVLEIKTGKPDPSLYAEQLFYEAKGRDAYLLCFEWNSDRSLATRGVPALDLVLYRVRPYIGEKPNKRRDKTIAGLNAKLASKNAEVEKYTSSNDPILIRCHTCNRTWTDTYYRITSGAAVCTVCHPELKELRKRARSSFARTARATVSKEAKQKARVEKYAAKVSDRSKGTLEVQRDSYTGSKEKVTVHCKICGRSWTPRADHLLDRCFCSVCKKAQKH